MPGCRAELGDNPYQETKLGMFKEGLCYGLIEGLVAGAKFSESVFKQALLCVPEQVTGEQELRVVIIRRMHERFTWLAIMALSDA
jgi:hypothetical protein